MGHEHRTVRKRRNIQKQKRYGGYLEWVPLQEVPEGNKRVHGKISEFEEVTAETSPKLKYICFWFKAPREC